MSRRRAKLASRSSPKLFRTDPGGDGLPSATVHRRRRGARRGAGYQRFLQTAGSEMAVLSRSFVYCE
jgi:hypothetical protein